MGGVFEWSVSVLQEIGNRFVDTETSLGPKPDPEIYIFFDYIELVKVTTMVHCLSTPSCCRTFDLIEQY